MNTFLGAHWRAIGFDNTPLYKKNSRQKFNLGYIMIGWIRLDSPTRIGQKYDFWWATYPPCPRTQLMMVHPPSLVTTMTSNVLDTRSTSNHPFLKKGVFFGYTTMCDIVLTIDSWRLDLESFNMNLILCLMFNLTWWLVEWIWISSIDIISNLFDTIESRQHWLFRYWQ